jgi:UDP-N-acetylmuramate dehydrogenase
MLIQENVPLAPLTSFRVGGNAAFYAEVKNIEELKEALAYAKSKNLEYYVLGGGTNLLVSDQGFSGLIIRMKMNEIAIEGNSVVAEAGVPLIKAINFAATAGLGGMEKMAGIPGTIGGAVRGNAGAFGSEMVQCVSEASALNTKTLQIETFNNAQCDFEYRSSIFKKNPNLIVVSIKIDLEKGDPEKIQQNTKETIVKRTSSGLHGVKSAGSYFMNPAVGNEKLKEEFTKEKGVEPRGGKLPAGWVIEQAGLGGKRIGGAGVSELHANYITNEDNATASEIMMLVSYVKQQVRDQFGVQLQEEINYLGF